MAKLHVLQVIDGLNIGGAEMLLRELSIGLLNRGFRVTIAYGSPGPLVDDIKALGLQLIHIPRIIRVDPWQFYNMYTTMRSEKPDIVHTHLFKSDFHGRPAARLAGVPVVVSTLHSIDQWAKQWPLGTLYGLTARFADRIISVSDDVKNFHVNHTNVDASKFVTIENGVDFKRYVGEGPVGWAIRKELGADDSSIVFGIIGRLTQPKDHETFLIAAKSILAKVPDARFWVIGDGPLRMRLTQLADKLGISNFLKFTGFRKDIPDVLSALDVLVISSVWEGLPVTLLEGMAASKPVVATAVGGVTAVVTKETAILVNCKDSIAISDACVKLAVDPELRLSMGRAGRDRVIKEYGIDAMVDRTVSLYTELLKMRGRQDLIPAGMDKS